MIKIIKPAGTSAEAVFVQKVHQQIRRQNAGFSPNVLTSNTVRGVGRALNAPLITRR